ncbi:hypothetical protein P4S63_23340 [Pseudoalteromonas sp. B193]
MIDGVPQSTPLRNGSLGVKTLDASAIARIEVIKAQRLFVVMVPQVALLTT